MDKLTILLASLILIACTPLILEKYNNTSKEKKTKIQKEKENKKEKNNTLLIQKGGKPQEKKDIPTLKTKDNKSKKPNIVFNIDIPEIDFGDGKGFQRYYEGFKPIKKEIKIMMPDAGIFSVILTVLVAIILLGNVVKFFTGTAQNKAKIESSVVNFAEKNNQQIQDLFAKLIELIELQKEDNRRIERMYDLFCGPHSRDVDGNPRCFNPDIQLRSKVDKIYESLDKFSTKINLNK